MMMVNKQNKYWADREAAERGWQAQQEKNLEAYNKHLAELYQNAIDELNKEIKADLAYSGGKVITAKAIEEYETLAQQVVAKAQVAMAKENHVTRKNFSKDVNDRLKVYNATMRINRNEILKSKIGAHLVSLGINQESFLTKKLWNDYVKEKERQAGILKISTSNNLWSSQEVQKQIYRQVANAQFSSRIWAGIDALKGTLDGLVSTAIVRGDNPREVVKWLTGMVSDSFTNSRYAAERLARTETARVQVQAAKAIFNKYGYKFVMWYAEEQACRVCREIAETDSNWGSGVYRLRDVPDIPVHPNCMCSIGAYWIDEEKALDDDLSDEQLVSRYLNDNLSEKLGTEDATALAKILSQAPDDIKQVWQMYHNQLKLDAYPKGGGTSFYRPGQGVTIYQKSMNLRNDMKYYQKKYDVFFHEFGHMIDYLAGDVIPNTPINGFVKEASGWIIDSIDKDWDKLIDKRYQKLVKDLKFSRIEGNKAEVANHPGYWLKVKKDGTPYASSLKQIRKDAAVQLVQEIAHDTEQISSQDKGDLSDIMSGLGFEYPLGVGHSRSYWRQAGKSGRATEAWAELTAATINNPGSEKIIKKYFRDTVDKYHETLKEIIKHGKK